MKKILRLVTTSVLTLTLVACGEASSSVSTSGSQTSSSVSSTTSAFANVSTITLTAASDALTQVMGTQKAVVVQAALNANTNPSLALEWSVNGTKSNQTGRVFEYTPAAAGTFVIEAKVGSVVSNKITLTVGTPALAITGEVKVVDADTIEITAPGGATVAVTNNEVLATSMFDLAKGVYVINLKTPLVQGVSSTVTLTREGSQSVSRVFTFDTRKVEINAVTGTGVTDNKDGTYSINRPHTIVAGENGGENLTVNSYQVTFKATNLKNTSAPFSLERLSAPTGAAAFTNQSGFINVAGDTDSASGSFDFSLNKATVAGDYSYRYTLGTKVVLFTVKVLVPAMAVKLDTYDESDDYDSVTGGTQPTVYLSTTGAAITATTFKYDLKYEQKWPDNASGTNERQYLVPKNADGSYDIVKDFLEDSHPTNASKEIQKVVEFRYFGEFFDVPSTLVAQTSIEPNQVMVNLVGPGGVAFMRVQPSLTQDVTFQTPETFRADFANRTVTQRIDSNTVVGTYTYTIRVMQSGVEIFKRDVVINVKAPEAKLDFTATQLDYSAYQTAYAAEKLRLETLVTVFSSVDLDAENGLATNTRTELPTLFNNNAKSFISPIIATSYSDEMYKIKKAEWVAAYLTARPFPALGADQTAWNTGLNTLHKSISPDLAQVNTAAADTLSPGEFDVLVNDYATAYYAAIVTNTAAGGSTQASDLKAALVWAAAGAGTTRPTATYDELKASYIKVVESLYPGNTVTPVAKAAETDKVTYVIEKPRASGLDSQTIAFDLKISNLQSESNPLAALTDAFTSPKSSLKAQFLTYVESSVGPGEIRNNNALNTKNTKVAVELGFANGSNIADILTQNLADTTTKYPYFASTTDSITLGDIFTFDVDFLTVSGNYTFTVRVGSLEKSVIVQVKDPVVKIDFGVATGGNFVKNTTDGKFYYTQTSTSNTATATFTLEVKNIAHSATAAYTVVKVDHKGNRVETTNTVATTAKDGNDGHAISPNLLNVVGDAGTANITLAAASVGTHTYSITLGGVTETVTLVFQEYPTVKVKTAKIGSLDLPLVDGHYVFTADNKATKFDFGVEGTTLGTGTTYYKITTGSLGTPGVLTDSSSTLAARLTALSLVELKFTSGIAPVIYEQAAVVLAPAQSEVITLVNVLLYKQNATTGTNFDFVGHATIKLVNVHYE
jgi:hypothetical protein